MKGNPTRRQVLIALAGGLVAAPALASRLLQPTPRQTAGPFYPVELPLDHDNDLTRIQGSSGVAQGQITELTGRILALDGRPLPNARVEIWQCDFNGRYRHPGDRRGPAPDPYFQGFGRTTTDNTGRYRFRTIRPVPYPGRTPHIHMAVFPEGESPFVTQLYVEGEPRNTRDFLFNRIPVERQPLVLAEFRPTPGQDAELAASFDIVLGGRDGTPSA